MDNLPAAAKQQMPSQSSPLGASGAELLACLTLVAPGGMTGEERAAWVSIAGQTLKDLPADVVKAGCRKAREKCRFPSEIVPTIMEEAEPVWDGMP